MDQHVFCPSVSGPVYGVQNNLVTTSPTVLSPTGTNAHMGKTLHGVYMHVVMYNQFYNPKFLVTSHCINKTFFLKKRKGLRSHMIFEDKILWDHLTVVSVKAVSFKQKIRATKQIWNDKAFKMWVCEKCVFFMCTVTF